MTYSTTLSAVLFPNCTDSLAPSKSTASQVSRASASHSHPKQLSTHVAHYAAQPEFALGVSRLPFLAALALPWDVVVLQVDADACEIGGNGVPGVLEGREGHATLCSHAQYLAHDDVPVELAWA